MPLQNVAFPVNRLIPFAFLAVCMLPWLIVSGGQITFPDMLWLSEGMRRILNGGTMTSDAYDPNPPLSLLVHILPVLLQRWLPLPYGLFLQTLALCCLSAWTLRSILKQWPLPGTNTPDYAVIAFFLLNTVGAGFFFGERDQFAGLALIPFTALQVALTLRFAPSKRRTWVIFGFAAPFLLLKPHYGLLPTLILAHRLFRIRNFSILKDPDFICLAVASLSYIVFFPLFFPDYFSNIFPDVLKLYLPLRSWHFIAKPLLNVVIGCIALEAVKTIIVMDHKTALFFHAAIGAALINLIPFYVLGMGLGYQLLPALSFAAIALGILTSEALSTHLRPVKYVWAIAIPLLALAAYGLGRFQLAHSHYKDLPLSRLVLKACEGKNDCSFFMYNNDMGLIEETAYFTEVPYASRFPSLWFFPVLSRERANLDAGHPSAMTKADYDYYFKKYAGFMAEDFHRYRPDIAIILREKNAFRNGFAQFFSDDENFAREWKHYRKTGDFHFAYSQYYPRGEEGVAFDYEIYRRIPDSPIQNR